MIRLATAAWVALMAPALAHDHAIGVVKERMDMMEAMAKSMKAIGDKLKARRNLAAVRKDAEAIRGHAPHLPHMFPSGSTQPPTEAKPAIWQNFADFEARAKALEAAAAALAVTDPRDADALAAQVRVVAEACSGCHDLYREKRAKN